MDHTADQEGKKRQLPRGVSEPFLQHGGFKRAGARLFLTHLCCGSRRLRILMRPGHCELLLAQSGTAVECQRIVFTWKNKIGALGVPHGEVSNTKYVGVIRPCLWANLGKPGQPAGNTGDSAGHCIWEIVTFNLQLGNTSERVGQSALSSHQSRG